jgi:hypothetical protein
MPLKRLLNIMYRFFLLKGNSEAAELVQQLIALANDGDVLPMNEDTPPDIPPDH